jgi:hypothetical protein
MDVNRNLIWRDRVQNVNTTLILLSFQNVNTRCFRCYELQRPELLPDLPRCRSRDARPRPLDRHSGHLIQPEPDSRSTLGARPGFDQHAVQEAIDR